MPTRVTYHGNGLFHNSSPEDGEREIVLMRWGLIPAKTADPDTFKTFSTTNARAETILEKPIWRGPFLTTSDIDFKGEWCGWFFKTGAFFL